MSLEASWPEASPTIDDLKCRKRRLKRREWHLKHRERHLNRRERTASESLQMASEGSRTALESSQPDFESSQMASKSLQTASESSLSASESSAFCVGFAWRVSIGLMRGKEATLASSGNDLSKKWREWGRDLELNVTSEGSETKNKTYSVSNLLWRLIRRHCWLPIAMEIIFVVDNNIDSCDFVFSDELFSSLFVTFSDEMSFIINSVLSITFSDKSFRHKKLKLLVTK